MRRANLLLAGALLLALGCSRSPTSPTPQPDPGPKPTPPTSGLVVPVKPPVAPVTPAH